MPRKKKEETAEGTLATTDEANVEAQSADLTETAEENTAQDASAQEDTSAEEKTSMLGGLINTVSSAVGSVAETVSSVATTITNAVGLTGGGSDAEIEAAEKESHRAQRIGVVTSDKMTKTVVVRVDRLIKHPKYRRYVRRKKQFMAHDELGATTGDKVRIIETRPLSARKRWRVAEIVQKAAK